MTCMRCGKEISDGAVFCHDCLADMAQSPVNPDSPIFLPPPRAVVNPRQRKRANKRTVDLIRRYRRLSKALAIALAIVLIVSGITVAILVQMLRRSDAKQNIGQNYSTVTPESRKAN